MQLKIQSDTRVWQIEPGDASDQNWSARGRTIGR